MKTFLLKISSPEGDLFCDNVESISLRGTEGELMIMAGHIPFVTAVVECNLKITLVDESEREAHTGGGMLTVSGDKTVFLSGDFGWL